MFDAGSTGFMLVCAMLVFLMTPGLAFFYGGLSRRKNVVNTMIMSFAVIGIVGVTWTVCGWSFAYGGDGSIPFFGGFDQIGLQGLVAGIVSEAPEALSHDAYPAMADVVFQLAFCMITTAIITGAVAGRMKFGAVCAFVAVWTVVVYPPLAHMVWGGEGSLVGDTIGALDFAGGDVVHISSGLTGLILCLIAGKRRGFGMVSYRPHNVPFVALGATLLWFGWFGFNAGSEFAPDGVAALALANTVAASGAALVSWMLIERVRAGKPTLVGAATGLVAGLVVITSAAGFVEPWAAVVMGRRRVARVLLRRVVSQAEAGLRRRARRLRHPCRRRRHGRRADRLVLRAGAVVDRLRRPRLHGEIPRCVGAQVLGILVTVVFVGRARRGAGLRREGVLQGQPARERGRGSARPRRGRAR